MTSFNVNFDYLKQYIDRISYTDIQTKLDSFCSTRIQVIIGIAAIALAAFALGLRVGKALKNKSQLLTKSTNVSRNPSSERADYFSRSMPPGPGTVAPHSPNRESSYRQTVPPNSMSRTQQSVSVRRSVAERIVTLPQEDETNFHLVTTRRSSSSHPHNEDANVVTSPLPQRQHSSKETEPSHEEMENIVLENEGNTVVRIHERMADGICKGVVLLNDGSTFVGVFKGVLKDTENNTGADEVQLIQGQISRFEGGVLMKTHTIDECPADKVNAFQQTIELNTTKKTVCFSLNSGTFMTVKEDEKGKYYDVTVTRNNVGVISTKHWSSNIYGEFESKDKKYFGKLFS